MFNSLLTGNIATEPSPLGSGIRTALALSIRSKHFPALLADSVCRTEADFTLHDHMPKGIGIDRSEIGSVLMIAARSVLC